MIILIQGPPGSGKTTLGRQLSKELNIPHVSKDDVKETLFDSLGFGTEEWSRKLGAASNQLLFLLMKQVGSNAMDIVIESNFHSDEFHEIERALSESNQQVVEIFLTAPREILMDRFKARWESGERHPGHVDDTRYEYVETYIDEGKSQPIALGGKVISIDTRSTDAASALSIVLREINR